MIGSEKAVSGRIRARLDILHHAADCQDEELLQMVAEVERLEDEHARLKREVARLRTRLAAADSGSMASKLKDALRE